MDFLAGHGNGRLRRRRPVLVRATMVTALTLAIGVSASATSFAATAGFGMLAGVGEAGRTGRLGPDLTRTGAPEYGRCVATPKGEGKFKSAECDRPEVSDGSFEWLPGIEKAGFTTTGGAGNLTIVEGAKIACKAETSKGEFEGTKEAKNVVARFTGCTALHTFNCTTEGAAEGEIVTEPLDGVLRWESISRKKVVLALAPASGEAGVFVSLACGPVPLTVRGSVLIPVVVDKMDVTSRQKLRAPGGMQAPSEYEEPGGAKVKDVLERESVRGGEPTGLQLTLMQTTEEETEVNALV